VMQCDAACCTVANSMGVENPEPGNVHQSLSHAAFSLVFFQSTSQALLSSDISVYVWVSFDLSFDINAGLSRQIFRCLLTHVH